MRIQFEEVPLDVRRRAARAVAALVGDRLSPTGLRKAEPRFGEAAPVYRPDLADIAYWEIEIAGLTTVLPTREGKAGRADRGFIVVATGGHDVPVPHFSLDTAPPSRQLEQLGAIDRVVKLDALCYAGLDDRGDLVGHIGTMPPKLTGMPDALPKRLPAGYATTVPAGAHDGEDGDKTEPQRVRTSRGKSVVELQEWRSWNEITTEYADRYRHQLAALAQRAQPRWETEKLTEEFGEGFTQAPRTRSGFSRKATSPSMVRVPTWSPPSSTRNRSRPSSSCDRAQTSAPRTRASRCTCDTPAAKNASGTSSCPTRHPRPP